MSRARDLCGCRRPTEYTKDIEFNAVESVQIKDSGAEAITVRKDALPTANDRKKRSVTNNQEARNQEFKKGFKAESYFLIKILLDSCLKLSRKPHSFAATLAALLLSRNSFPRFLIIIFFHGGDA